MKCKKILAMLLALCMVLSTFVAVSAADTVVIDIDEDYENGIGDTIRGDDISLDTVEEEEPEQPPVSGGIEFELAPKHVAGTLEDGVYTVTEAQLREYAGATTTYDNCSYNDWLKIIPTTELDPEKTIKVSFDLELENLYNSIGQLYADRTVRLRIRDALGGNVVPADTYKATVTANTGDAQLVEFEIPVADIAGVDHFGVNVDMQGPLASSHGENEYFKISNVAIEYVGEEEEPELPPVTPEEPEEPELPPVDPDEPEVPEEPGEIEYFNAVEIEASLDDANEITYKGKNVTVETATEEIGGRTDVIKASGVANNNDSVVGMLIGEGFKFMPGDKLIYSVDVYSANGITPNLWLRCHGGIGAQEENPFNSNFKPAGAQVPAGTWTTIEHEVAYENFGDFTPSKAPEGWSTTGKWALYFRGDFGTIYLDNFSITVEREFVATIEEVEFVEAGADNATFRVVADGAIDIDTIAATIDGVEVDVTAEVEDELNTLVTVTGLAPNTEYTFAVTGAKNPNNRDVTVADEADCTVNFTTIAEVDTEAALSGDTVTFALTNNLSETETIHIVLLRCKGNTVVDTIAVPVEAAAGEPVEDSIEVPELGNGEYYRFFAWTYENGVINSMANLIDLD